MKWRHDACWSAIVTFALVLFSGIAPAAGPDDPATWQPAQQSLARLGDGYLVWESRRLVGVGGRKGEWSLWTIALDGSGLRQFAPDEPNRNQTSPHISPDGTRVVYLSFPAQGGEHMDAMGEKVPLHMINRDGSGDKIIVPDARQYSGWDRAVVWFNDNELAYIGGDGNTYQLNLTTNQSTLLIKRSGPDAPMWLPNITKTHAAWSFNTFSLLDAKAQTVTEMPHLGGCQPYFCQDGIWGFWEGGIGGPINKMHLATRAISPILDRSAMPPERNFVYFPMISDDNRLLAFAATDKVIGGYGGYTESDYEIFLVQLDPKTLDVIGKPIRYSFQPKCDRFPDVWQARPELGFQSNEAPFTADFKADRPLDATWQWDFGDGSAPAAGVARHTYEKPGTYIVTARQGDRVLHGQVRVAEATAPKGLDALLESPQEILVAFDEPVDLSKVRVELQSKAEIARHVAGDDGRSLRISLKNPLAAADTLLVEGAADLAQQPHAMEPARFALQPRLWPASRDGLGFLWENAKARNIVRDPQTGDLSAYSLSLRDRAWYDRNNAAVFDGGNASIPGFGDKFSNAVRNSGQFTYELTITPRNMERSRQCILSNGLSQDHDKLLFDKVPLCTLKANQPNHVAITRSSGADGRLICYLDGREVFNATRADSLAGFRFQWVSVGNNLDDQPWFGTIEGIALYSRAFNADEALAHAKAYGAVMASHKPANGFEADAKLVAVSPPPKLKDIQPYKQALAVYEYDIQRVTAGAFKPGKVRVAHWVLLDSEPQRIAQAPLGAIVHLQLEPFDANSQLAEEYMADALTPDPEAPLYFAIREVLPFTGAREWNAIALPKDASRDIKVPQPIEGTSNILKTYTLQEGQKWTIAKADERGWINLMPVAGEGAGYALVHVTSPEERKVIVSCGAVGGMKVWLNGASAIDASDLNRYPFHGSRQAPAVLPKGTSEIMIKVSQCYAFMQAYCDILDTNGREMPDLIYSAERR